MYTRPSLPTVILEKSKVGAVETIGAAVQVRPPLFEHEARETRATAAFAVRIPLQVVGAPGVAVLAKKSRQTAYT